MQTAGKKNRSTIDNLIILNAIKEKQDNKNTYIFYADAEKYFNKLWLKDSLIEMERIGHNKSDIKMLYEINKTTEIVVDTAIGNTKSIEIICGIALIYGIEAWGYTKKEENKEIERIQEKALKIIFKLLVSTAYTKILMETGIWPAEQGIQYVKLILCHDIKNSNEEKKIKEMIEEQEKKNYNNTFYKKVQQRAETLVIEIDNATNEKKSTWKKEVKEKVISKVKKRMSEEMAGRTKCQAIENDKWGRKEYIKESNSGTIKDIINIRLHMWKLKANYGRKGLGIRCPMC